MQLEIQQFLPQTLAPFYLKSGRYTCFIRYNTGIVNIRETMKGK